MVEWFWWDSSLISTTNWFPRCFNTVGLVIGPVKIVAEMTYNVSNGTLNPTHSHSLRKHNAKPMRVFAVWKVIANVQ